VKGRRVEITAAPAVRAATEQFRIHDTRSAADIAAMLRRQNLDPVWKDWDPALLAAG
jgi:2-iminoacetate synthase